MFSPGISFYKDPVFRRKLKDYFRIYAGFYVAGIFAAHFLDFTGGYWSEIFLTMYMVYVIFLIWLTYFYHKNRMLKDKWWEISRRYGLIPFSFIPHSLYWVSPGTNLLAAICLAWGITSFILPFMMIHHSRNSPRRKRLVWLQDMRRRNAEQYKKEKRREWHPRCRKVRRRVYPEGINQKLEGFF